MGGAVTRNCCRIDAEVDDAVYERGTNAPGSGDFEADCSQGIGMDVYLFHPGEQFRRDRVVLMALDMLPVDGKWERGDDIRDADDHVILGTKSVAWERVGLTF
jgi:hypothetical protein